VFAVDIAEVAPAEETVLQFSTFVAGVLGDDSVGNGDLLQDEHDKVGE
jgi:hypothetical protein